MEFSELRNDYGRYSLNEDQLPADPVRFFEEWMSRAIETGVKDPNAMVLSTVSADQKPSSRVVLLKGMENGRFLFFTNYNSRKGTDLQHNAFASLLFYWPDLERQVRIEGKVSKVPSEVSDSYFMSRPPESRISAAVSPQSRSIGSRRELESLVEKYKSQGEVTRPEHWGGYQLEPESFEFWQGRPNRLHDRFRYCLVNEKWEISRLAP